MELEQSIVNNACKVIKKHMDYIEPLVMQSDKQDREISGAICRSDIYDGDTFVVLRKGGKWQSQTVSCPIGTTKLVDFHTHPDEPTIEPSVDDMKKIIIHDTPECIGTVEKEGYDIDIESPMDILRKIRNSKSRVKFRCYRSKNLPVVRDIREERKDLAIREGEELFNMAKANVNGDQKSYRVAKMMFNKIVGKKRANTNKIKRIFDDATVKCDVTGEWKEYELTR